MFGLLAAAMVSFFPQELEEWYSMCRNGDWTAAAAEAEMIMHKDTTCIEAIPAYVIVSSLEAGPFEAGASDLHLPDTLSSLSATAMGMVLMSGSDSFLEDAEFQLMEAVRLDPDNTLAWYALGMLKMRLESSAAESCIVRAVHLDTDFLPARLEAARLRRDRSDLSGALNEFLEIWATSTPSGDLALAEYVLLSDSMGMAQEADSMGTVMDLLVPRAMEHLARQQLQARPVMALRAARRAWSEPSPELAALFLELGDNTSAAEMSRILLSEGTGDSTDVLIVLGTSLFRMEDDGSAKDAFLRVLDRDPGSVQAMVHLGRIAERAGDTGSAVDRYLMTLELDPFSSIARERLREIADDSYDPGSVAGSSRGFSLTAGADLSVEMGSRSLFEWGGSTSVSYRFDSRGTSIDGSIGGRSVTWEESYGIKKDTLNTNRGWANLGFDYWFSDSWYLQAASSWDRQMYTERPWQVSSYGALGWQKWMLSWFWFSPRLGVGSVNARWTTGIDDVYTSDFSIFAAAGLMYSKPHTFIRRAEISGDLYFPPDDPENFISRGSISLAFRTWSPLYVTMGYSMDYTRSPEISSWEKLNTSFTTSVNLDLY
jgi:tetratricopeptide (TPR) repeat protein